MRKSDYIRKMIRLREKLGTTDKEESPNYGIKTDEDGREFFELFVMDSVPTESGIRRVYFDPELDPDYWTLLGKALSILLVAALIGCQEQPPQKALKFKRGQVVELVVSGKKGQIVDKGYYRSDWVVRYTNDYGTIEYIEVKEFELREWKPSTSNQQSDTSWTSSDASGEAPTTASAMPSSKG